MKITKALKQKNKLVKEIQSLKSKISQYICTEEGADESPYNVHTLAAELNQKKKELIDLKVKIQTKNVEILEKMYTLSELKDTLIWMKGLPVGVTSNREYRNGEYMLIKRYSAFDVKDTDTVIEKIQTQIELIQDELDHYNATTDID
jgi:hypothetical protein